MAAVRVSIRPVVSHEPVVRALAKFILAASVFVVLFAGLFPFDFHIPRYGAWEHIKRTFDSSPEPALLEDKVQNVLFFVPFGFGFAATFRTKRKAIREFVQVGGAIVCGAILSMTVETLQVFLGFRDPTWLDLLMNTLGAGLGAAIVAFGADKVLDNLARPLLALKPYVTFRNVALLLIVYVVVVLAMPYPLGSDRGSLQNWDSGHVLLVGNDLDRNRPWSGDVWQVEVAARAASRAEVEAIFREGTGRNVLSDALVGVFDTIGDPPFPDRTGLLRELNWAGERIVADREIDPPAAQEGAGFPTRPTTVPTQPAPSKTPARVNGLRWLQTPVAVAPASHRIRQHNQFTLITSIRPDELFQSGPARIVSISGGTYQRNVSVMHEHHGLSIRLRTKLLGLDGSAPESIIEDVFDSPKRRQIALTYRDSLMVAYVDGVERGRMEITPETALIWRLYPRTGWKVKVTQYGFRSYAVVYRVLVLVPFAALLAATVSLSTFPQRQQWLLAAGVILIVTVVFELIMGSLTVSGFQFRNLLISIAVAALMFAALKLRATNARPTPSYRW